MSIDQLKQKVKQWGGNNPNHYNNPNTNTPNSTSTTNSSNTSNLL